MQKMPKLTCFLLILVLGTIGLAYTRHTQVTATKDNQDPQRKEVKRHFPTADYDEADLRDPEKDRIRKEKQKRHNGFKIVGSKPSDWETEVVFIGEGSFNFPALPGTQSDFVLIGTVTDAQAHLSENKKNVFSEFTISVADVLKTGNSSVTTGAVVTIYRNGGFVKYPNGRTILCRISGSNMPKLNGKYVFFLKSKGEDSLILTAYELTEKGVLPLDDSPQFEPFRGVNEDTFLQTLRDSLAKSSPN